ncbi:hypothetical protein AB0L56_21815 [Streptomyces sp. NPDC052079]|uniref:hypothetical protein n=1 Tax=Streptomyces sp. NPDC052079 TaxID=3155526 RepID=UPI00343D65A6
MTVRHAIGRLAAWRRPSQKENLEDRNPQEQNITHTGEGNVYVSGRDQVFNNVSYTSETETRLANVTERIQKAILETLFYLKLGTLVALLKLSEVIGISWHETSTREGIHQKAAQNWGFLCFLCSLAVIYCSLRVTRKFRPFSYNWVTEHEWPPDFLDFPLIRHAYYASMYVFLNFFGLFFVIPISIASFLHAFGIEEFSRGDWKYDLAILLTRKFGPI